MPGGLGSLRWCADRPATDAPDFLCLERHRALCTGAGGSDDWAGGTSNSNCADGTTANLANPEKGNSGFDGELRSALGRCKWELRTEAPENRAARRCVTA